MLKGFSYKKNYLAGLIIIALGFTLLSPCLSRAQSIGRYSESEKVGFAFYQFAKFNPDFKKWVVNMDKYKKALPVEKIEVVRKETNRLQNGYFNYVPESDLVVLKMKATIKAPDRPSHYPAENQNKDDRAAINIELSGLPENYFPFYIGGMWIAVVIKDFDTVTKFAFTKEKYARFSKQFNLQKQPRHIFQKVDVGFKLRPLSVDTSSPVEIEGLEMWLMLADIAEMEVWRSNFREKEYLLTYKAPWFVSERDKELLDLYHE